MEIFESAPSKCFFLCCMTADSYHMVGPHPQGQGEKLSHLTILTKE